jgi:SHS2 domain-containing protein
MRLERALRRIAPRGGAMQARHRLIEHTGEIELFVEAPDLRALLAEAARALAEVMAEDAAGTPDGEVEHVELSSRDRASLLADWLNELVYRADVHKRVYADVTIERASDTHLEATMRGRSPHAPRTAVKAATWHRLAVTDVPGGLHGIVVLDV